jgi:hypothetical protein
MRHTPGPLLACPYLNAFGSYPIKTVAGGDTPHNPNVGSARRMEDARLFAAAPELLELVRQFLAAHPCDLHQCANETCLAVRARAALAKVDA